MGEIASQSGPPGESREQRRERRALERQQRAAALEEVQRRQAETDAAIVEAEELVRRGIIRPPTREEVLARAGVTELELTLSSALAAASAREADDALRLARTEAMLDFSVAGGEWLRAKIERQQAGNQSRRVAEDGWEEEAAARHVAGEPWKTIAPDYGLGERRCRELVHRKGLKTRGKR